MTEQEKLVHLKEDRGLICYIALKYYKRYKLEKDDAIQCASIAYWTGLDLWDPDKGTLSAFMGVRIQQKLKVEGWKCRSMQGSRSTPIIINEGEQYDPSKVVSRDDTPEEAYFKNVYAKELVHKVLRLFSERDQRIITNVMKGATLKEEADKYGISHQRVQQLYQLFKDKVRQEEERNVR